MRFVTAQQTKKAGYLFFGWIMKTYKMCTITEVYESGMGKFGKVPENMGNASNL